MIKCTLINSILGLFFLVLSQPGFSQSAKEYAMIFFQGNAKQVVVKYSKGREEVFKAEDVKGTSFMVGILEDLSERNWEVDQFIPYGTGTFYFLLVRPKEE